MTNAQIHEAAVIQRFGGLPFTVPGLPVETFKFEADPSADALNIEIEWWREDGVRRREKWRYPDPEILYPDPAGEHLRHASDDEGNPIEMRYRVDPLAVAVGEVAAFLSYCMARP